ncbi:MAG TPA: A/G-specific adenine glycosylase [Aggregatilineales bacterium]|nr:A/G-specific adenine glycosylase [Anaerolineales bacterium]HRE48836.1 A/G-specific adenine glycosylase [Aggregatilineales bacterium]
MIDSHSFAAALAPWFVRDASDRPWRHTRDPYRVWLSEVMLQQTQSATVVPYYEKFAAAYPTVHALAAAPLDQVLKLWEGLGYYSRARNMHRAAQIVAAGGGQFPQTAALLQNLPGVGRYTAAAVASIVFGERVAVLDGNVIRVLARLYDLPADVTMSATQRHLWALAEGLIAEAERPGDHNQAMMELGSRICTPRSPDCPNCPVQTFCRAHANNTQGERPVKARKAKTPHRDVASGVIYDAAGRFLIAQRPLKGLLGGLWEFPAAFREGDESLGETLARALSEQCGIQVEIGDVLATVKHAFSHFRITLHAHRCRYLGGEIALTRYIAAAWVTPAEVDHYALARADRRMIEVLLGRSSPKN